MLRLLTRFRAERLSDSFAARVGGPPPPPSPCSVIGLEHEYAVRRAGAQIDFRPLVHELAPSARGLQPADPNAFWLRSGALLTADEIEAEIALPPIATTPGFSRLLDREAHRHGTWLRGVLPHGCSLEGVSTHLSICLPDAMVEVVADTYARTFALAAMLLMDAATSPGMLVRPRPGRLELCGEFTSGEDLRAVALFALGSTLACLTAVGSGGPEALPQLRLRIRYGNQRYGWYVDRRAPGPDLYVEGRATRLLTGAGKAWTAQQHLEQAWSLARTAAEAHADGDEINAVDRLIDGRRPLRIERPIPGARRERPKDVAAPERALAGVRTTPYGRALEPRHRPGFDVAPIMITWDLALFVLAGRSGGRRAYAAVPGSRSGRFLDELDAGRLDEVIGTYLRARPTGRRLSSHAQARRPGLYDGYAIRASLMAPERPLVRPGEEAA